MAKNNIVKSKDVDEAYFELKAVLEQGRTKAIRSFLKTSLETYWNMGRVITEHEQKGEDRARYGTQLLKKLSERFTSDYGRGYQARNLRYFRQFYLAFPKWNAVSQKLGWTHYRSLLKLDSKEQREFYINHAIEENWSTRELDRQVNSLLYERVILGKGRKGRLEIEAADYDQQKPSDVVKDPYFFEFLGIPEKDRTYKESQVEQALIDKLQEFIIELGKGFAFVRRQYRITTETQHFFVDLVFFNYILNRFFVIELKIGRLAHKDIGQLDFYVRYFDEEVKLKSHNTTVGLILCSTKDATVVKYSVLKDSEQLFASEYKLYLPSEKELREEIEKVREEIEEKEEK